MAVLRVVTYLIAGLLTPGLCEQATAGGHIERQIRAAFLYNFTKYVEWPAGALPESGSPFRMCVSGDQEFARLVSQIVEGESVRGHQIVTSAPRSSEEARACHILFLAGADSGAGTDLLAAVRDLPVLTVGDSPRFLDTGGAIRFVLDNNRVRFDISIQPIDRTGLKISSKLLRVARTVKQGEETR